MRKFGENPKLLPLLYVRETVVRGVSRSLGKPEKAGGQTPERCSEIA